MPSVSNPLVAGGVATTEFSTALSRAPSAAVKVGKEQLQLTRRGRGLLAKLLEAEPATVAHVESLLSGDEQLDLVSPEEAAALLGVSRPTVVRWAGIGDLTDHPVGTHHRFARVEVLKLRDQRSQAAAANRAAARRAREQAAATDNLDVPPTPAELIAAGQALRDGDPQAAAGVLARARRADVRRAADAAAS